MISNTIRIRPLTLGDLPKVEEIERLSFPNAWSFRELYRFVRTPGIAALAAESGEGPQSKVVGFAFVEKSGSSSHILNFAVHPDHRRARIGQKLMDAVVGHARTNQLVRMTLEVRESNLDAQLFYRSLGFKATRILKGHYRDSDEDGYRLECPVGEPVGAAADSEAQ